ncbi:MAG: DUF4407 domain-containing protein [Actinomycetota bacterium]
MADSEREHLSQSGAYVLLATALAFVSGLVLSSFVLDRPRLWLVAPVAASILAAAVFLMDRSLVTANIDRSRPVAGAIVLGPRVVFSLCMAFLVSEPLLSVVFAHEIESQMTADARADIDARTIDINTALTVELDRINERTAELTTPNPQLSAARQAVTDADQAATDARADEAALREQLRNERAGVTINGSTGTPGDGPVTEALEAEIAFAEITTTQTAADLEAARARLTTLETANTAAAAAAAPELATLDERRAAIEAERTNALVVAEAEAFADRGLLARLAALEHLATSSPLMGVFVWALRLVLLLIDLGPLVHKLAAISHGPSTYAEAVELRRELERHRLAELRKRRMSVVGLRTLTGAPAPGPLPEAAGSTDRPDYPEPTDHGLPGFDEFKGAGNGRAAVAELAARKEHARLNGAEPARFTALPLPGLGTL